MLDENKIAADFLNKRMDQMLSAAGNAISGAVGKAKVRIRRNYSRYLRNVADRLSKTKSFFFSTEATPLYDFYVPLDLELGGETISKPSYKKLCKLSACFVITGSAGCGKSTMMKHLAVSALASRLKVPVFVALRDLDQLDCDVENLILSSLKDGGLDLDTVLLQVALRHGHFAIFLDGFDEVTQDRRVKLSREIQELASRYPENAYFLSSRPDNEFKGWDSFSEATMEPLTLDLAVELIEKLPYDSSVKDHFLLELKGGLFEQHRSFLSNPLLLSIMLLTYSDSAEVPSKLSVFYYQAYNALFHKHDAYKGAYKRPRKTPLDLQDFARVFEAVSILSYHERVLQMSREKALGYVKNAVALQGIDVDPEAFLDDAIQAVCLLVEDGLHLAFTHRSFQEYFAARFISSAKEEKQKDLLSRYKGYIRRDSLFPLLYELNPEMIERCYVLPEVQSLKDYLGFAQNPGITHYVKYMKSQWDAMRLEPNSFGAIRSMSRTEEASSWYCDVVAFAMRCCAHHIGWQGYGDYAKDSSFLWAKYGESGEPFTRVRVGKLTHRSQFMRDLSTHGCFFSLDTLKTVFKIAESIERTLGQREATLDEVFGLSS